MSATGSAGDERPEPGHEVAGLLDTVGRTDGRRLVVTDADGDGRLAEAAGGAFATVVLAGALGASTAPAALLRRLREESVVAPDGVLVVDAPDPTSLVALARVLDGSAGRPGPGGAPGAGGWSLPGLTALLESAGWFVAEVHRVASPPDQPATPALAAAARALADAAPGTDRSTAHHVVVARPAAEPNRQAELVSRAAAADRRADGLRQQVVLLERRLADTAAMLAEERARHAQLVGAGNAELAELRRARAAVDADLAERSRRAAKAEADLRALQSGPALAAGTAVLRVVGPVRRTRRVVGRAVRPLLRRLR